jgi:ABC-type nitrate/sulfonate/bicarbonate transport system substrate-binding protein
MESKSVLACVVLLLPVLAGTPAAAQALDKVTAVIPQNSVFVLNWQGAKDAGIFKKHGIDLTVVVRPFAGFLAGLPSKQTLAATYPGLEAIDKINHGLDWAVIGGGLTVVQEVIVRKDSPIKTLADLRGKRLGVWSTGAGGFKAARVAIMDAAGIDITKDTKLVQLAPPALFKLLENGQVDAMFNISSFTVEAASHPDKFRAVFAPNDYWKKKTGYPIAWAAPLVAWKSWVNENRARAEHYAEAVEESFRWLRKPENFEAAVKKYGTLASVSKPGQIAVYKKWLGEKRFFLAHWDQKVVDSQWQFLDTAKRYNMLSTVPDKAKHAMILEKPVTQN